MIGFNFSYNLYFFVDDVTRGRITDPASAMNNEIRPCFHRRFDLFNRGFAE